jgi:aconitate hydratase 2/2-methylisocitrate dehydratase
VAATAAAALKKTLLMFDFFNDVAEKAKAGNAIAKDVMQSWADAEWFTTRPEVPRRSPSPCSRCPAKPTPTTCRPRPTPGAAPTSRCTTWPC